MVELNLLKALSIRENLEKYCRFLNPKTLSIQSIELLKDYKKYFEIHQTEKIDFGAFKELFFIQLHPNLDEKSVLGYREIINQIQDIPLEGISCTQIIASFEQQELYQQLHNDLDNNLDVATIQEKLNKQQDRINQIQGLSEPLCEDMDLTLALGTTDRSKGLKWRLKCLNEHFDGGIIQGDFILLSGYVDSGKTGFLCSEVSHMAQQLKDDEYIAWLNTEGNWQQILPRIYQATLNFTRNDLTTWTDEAIIKYTEKMKGDKNRIKVLNWQRKGIKDVEEMIKKKPPKLLVFDLLDAFSGFDKYLGSEGNCAEKYGALYQWARVIATECCPVIAVSQLNRNGNDNAYPAMTELSGSGEKKQGAATAMIMLGSLQGNDTERYLSTPKNKIGGGKGFRQKIKFDPLRSRFSD